MKTYLRSRFYFSESCFPNGSVVKNPPAYAGATGDSGLIPGLGRNDNPIPVFLPGIAYRQRSLAGYSSCGWTIMTKPQ